MAAKIIPRECSVVAFAFLPGVLVTITPAAVAASISALTGPPRQMGELAVRLAHRLGGRAFGFPAPLLAPSQGFAEALQQLPEVRQALELAGSADCLAFGVGGLDWGTSPLNDSISAAERASLVRQGAVGDVAARFFDRVGNPVETTVDKRAIGLRLDQMVSVPTRLLLAHGPSKVEAIHASLVGGMATVLVTDSDTARSLEQMT